MDPKINSPQKRSQLEGRYANYFKIGYNPYEFVLDFSQHYGESEEAELCTRIITSPIYACELMKTLKESIVQYEERFGALAAPVDENDP